MKTRKHFTAEQRERAKRMRQSGYSLLYIAERLGFTKSAVGKLAARNFAAHTAKPRSRPMDLPIRIHEMTFNGLKAHYKVGAERLREWLDEGGFTLPDRHRAAPRRQIPDDFTTFAPGKSVQELQEHYQASSRVVTRWKLQSGVPAPRAELIRKRKAMQEQAQQRVGWAERYYAERRA